MLKKFKETVKSLIVKHGGAIATCAFAFVAIAANTSCGLPYYEAEEPQGLDSFKKFNK